MYVTMHDITEHFNIPMSKSHGLAIAQLILSTIITVIIIAHIESAVYTLLTLLTFFTSVSCFTDL